jgi:hypothetical protein
VTSSKFVGACTGRHFRDCSRGHAKIDAMTKAGRQKLKLPRDQYRT